MIYMPSAHSLFYYYFWQQEARLLGIFYVINKFYYTAWTWNPFSFWGKKIPLSSAFWELEVKAQGQGSLSVDGTMFENHQKCRKSREFRAIFKHCAEAYQISATFTRVVQWLFTWMKLEGPFVSLELTILWVGQQASRSQLSWLICILFSFFPVVIAV